MKPPSKLEWVIILTLANMGLFWAWSETERINLEVDEFIKISDSIRMEIDSLNRELKEIEIRADAYQIIIDSITE